MGLFGVHHLRFDVLQLFWHPLFEIYSHVVAVMLGGMPSDDHPAKKAVGHFGLSEMGGCSC